jgi:hypothetical protein
MLLIIATAEASIVPSPAHWHVLLNHLPLVGLTFALGCLVMGICLRSRAAQIGPLVAILLAAAAAYPVNVTGQGAYKPVRGIADEEGSRWLDAHMERAESYAWAYYTLTALTAVALIAQCRWPRSATSLSVATAIAAAACVGLSGWIAAAGGRIRHPEFRNEPAPADAADHTH